MAFSISSCIAKTCAARSRGWSISAGNNVSDSIQFNDGAAYERYMGAWSRLAGEAFLDWLAPVRGVRWLDVGCGNGAFTEMIAARCAPAAIDGIDPSEAQLAYAAARPALRAVVTHFHRGDAMALPLPNDTFDAAVMPLVIFFVPDPPWGVAEMARVVRPGGIVAAYAWDLPGNGFPYQPLHDEMRALGAIVPLPPSPDASRIDAMQELWTGAGLETVHTTAITVERIFADFDDYWTTIRGGPSVGRALAAMNSADTASLQERMRARLPLDKAGRITCSARANAVKGRAPH
jgi:SAM-dependent methyltransferase